MSGQLDLNGFHDVNSAWELISQLPDLPHGECREIFTWGRSLDGEGNFLPETEFIKLCDINDDHLIALVDWTKSGYQLWVHELILAEINWRKL